MKRKSANLIKNALTICTLLAVCITSGCGDDETPFVPEPSITFEATGNNEISFNGDRTILSVPSGTIVTWNIDIIVPGGFRSFSVAGLQEPLLIQDENSIAANVMIAEDDKTVSINNMPLSFMGDDALEISFITTDDLGQSNVVTLTIDISSPEARTVNDITMMSPVQNSPDTPEDDRTSATWFSANLGETITSADIVAGSSLSKDVDFGFYYANGQAVFASPASFPESQYNLSNTGQNWSTLHITTFRTLEITQSNFFTISNAFEIDEAYNNGEDSNEDGAISNVTAGSAIGFQSDVDKDGGIIRGIIFIRSVTPATDSAPASILFDVKIQ